MDNHKVIFSFILASSLILNCSDDDDFCLKVESEHGSSSALFQAVSVQSGTPCEQLVKNKFRQPQGNQVGQTFVPYQNFDLEHQVMANLEGFSDIVYRVQVHSDSDSDDHYRNSGQEQLRHYRASLTQFLLDTENIAYIALKAEENKSFIVVQNRIRSHFRLLLDDLEFSNMLGRVDVKKEEAQFFGVISALEEDSRKLIEARQKLIASRDVSPSPALSTRSASLLASASTLTSAATGMDLSAMDGQSPINQ